MATRAESNSPDQNEMQDQEILELYLDEGVTAIDLGFLHNGVLLVAESTGRVLKVYINGHNQSLDVREIVTLSDLRAISVLSEKHFADFVAINTRNKSHDHVNVSRVIK